MLRKLITTDSRMIGLIIRVALGIVILPHGLQKLVGMFGGYGFSATINYFGSVGIPSFIAFLIIMGESFGAIMLITGFGTRFAAASISLIMAGAMFVHLPNGFFMNWFGAQAGEGIEYFIVVLGLGIAAAINGGGKLSVDRLLLNKIKTV